MSIIRKAASSDVGPDLEFVLSDATTDRYGDVVEPDGWELGNFRKNPIALFNHSSNAPIGKWESVRVAGGKLVGKLALAAEGTSVRIDEIRRLVEQGILRATSVGFMPIEASDMRATGGTRFTRQELMEVSLVSVPANPNAVQMAKAMHVSDDTLSLVFGEHADGLVRRATPGKHAAPSTSHVRKSGMTTPLSKRIEDAQTALVRAQDDLSSHIDDADADADVTTALSEAVEQRQKALASFQRAEQALMARSEPSAPAAPAAKAWAAAAKKSKPGDLIVRAALVSGIAAHMHQDPLEVLDRTYGQDEGVAMVLKAAVAPATTTTTGWAAELVNTAMSDFLETLRPESVYPALSEAGGGRLTFGPNAGALKVPARAATPSIGGSFIGEGGAIPVRRLALTSVTLTPKKMGVITTFTREMARYSVVALESMLRQEITFDTAITLDGVLLGAGAGSADAPAGLLNGVSALTATAGGGAAAVLGDIRKLRAPFDAANAGSGLMLLMNPAQAESLELTPGADGTLGWATGIIARYRVAVSTAIPAGRIIMVRAADFASATGDVPEFELSNDATVHMEDTTPLAIGTAGTPNSVAAPVRSFFQTGVSGLRMIMDVSWVMRRAGMVQYIDTVTW